MAVEDDRDNMVAEDVVIGGEQDEGGANGTVGFAYSDGYQPVPNPKSADRDQLTVTIEDDDDQFSQKPDNHMIGALCVTLLCFFPTGLKAVMYSLKVNQLNQENKIRQARVMAERSKNWIIYTVVAFCVLLSIGTVSRILSVMFSPSLYADNPLHSRT